MTPQTNTNSQRAGHGSPSNGSRKRWIAWCVTFVAVLWILHTATQYFAMGVDRTLFMRHKVQLGFQPWSGWRLVLGVHVAAAVVAMATGAIALLLGVFKSRWSVHRFAGRTYAVAVVISAAAGFPLAWTATGGPFATTGFLVLNCVWLATVIAAFLLARQRDIARHRVWAVRSYAVTFANMTLHILTATLTGPLDSPTKAYTLAVWLCWLINLGAVEVVVLLRARLSAL